MRWLRNGKHHGAQAALLPTPSGNRLWPMLLVRRGEMVHISSSRRLLRDMHRLSIGAWATVQARRPCDVGSVGNVSAYRAVAASPVTVDAPKFADRAVPMHSCLRALARSR